MGASVGSRGAIVAELNVVPLIDILLVLLVIFMVITPLKSQGLSAVVPQQSERNEASSPEESAVIVQVIADPASGQSRLRINREEVSWDALGSRLDQIFRARADKVAFVQGDNDVMFMDVARAVDVARGAGVEKIGLVTARLLTTQLAPGR